MRSMLEKLVNRENLTEEETSGVFDAIMDGNLGPAMTAAILVLLRAKQEQPAELTGAVRAIRKRAKTVRTGLPLVLDTCGTGGDNTSTYNISTAVALLLAAGGVPVAKHGNRSVSSRSGSADVLEAMGYPIAAPADVMAHSLVEDRFAFFFAPLYHASMKNVAAVRKELAIRTIFNLIGPLCNPADANVQLMGVGDYRLLKTIPGVFRSLGIRGYVFCGEDGMDEITLTGKTFMVRVSDDAIEETEVYPQDLGFKRASLGDLSGGDAAENAEIICALFNGREKGPRRDICILNAAYGFLAAGTVATTKEGVACATALLDSGRAGQHLQTILDGIRERNT